MDTPRRLLLYRIMEDALLSVADREEALSRADLAAIAAAAGYVISTMDFDRDGVDVGVRAGGRSRPALDVQLKATINLGPSKDGRFQFPLKRRNYDRLIEPTMIPRILMVLSLPEFEADWLSVSVDQLILRRCAYWASLAGQAETENIHSVTVAIGDRDRLDVGTLRTLMHRARKGSLL